MMHARHNRGFTLIETLVAITILMLAISGPLAIASRGLQSSVIARDQLVATYLAQEAIETVRFYRDNAFLTSQPWLSALTPCTGGEACYFMFPDTDVTRCDERGPNPCPLINYNDQDAFPHYTYDAPGGSVSATSFRRAVWLEGSGDQERTIRVRVDWQSGSQTRFIEVENQITNWAFGVR